MEKLKRQIGYVAGKNNADPIEEALPIEDNIPATLVVENKEKAKFDIPSILQLQASSSKSIAKWIKSHPYFKWTRMCQEIGIDKGYFSRAINSEYPSFKLEEIPAIEKELGNYGYNN